MKAIRVVLSLAAVGLLILSNMGVAADTLFANPSTECVGRYQVTLPGKVEVAAISVDDIIHGEIGYIDSRILYRATFSDHSTAPFSSATRATRTIAPSDAENFSSRFKRLRDASDNQPFFIPTANRRWVELPLYNNKANAIWVTPYGYLAYVYINNRFYLFEYSDYDAKPTSDEAGFSAILGVLQDKLKSFHPRALYEIPTQPGVCSPYVFFLDDGNKTRNVGVTMRLIDHPDVEIFFQDSSYPFGYEVKTNNPETQLNAFWDNVGRIRDSIKYIDMDWHRYRDVNIAGIHGKGTFVTITNKDESKDYGYCAYAISTPEINVMADNKRVYVIRTAARAKAKGIEPVSKDDIKAIAESVMASIKRHPVSPGN